MHITSFPLALRRFIRSIIFVWDTEGTNSSFLLLKQSFLQNWLLLMEFNTIDHQLLILHQWTLSIQLKK